MKRIIIELTEEQHKKMLEFIEKGHKLNLENETFSGYGINSNVCEYGDWLEVDFNEVLNVGDVNWKIE